MSESERPEQDVWERQGEETPAADPALAQGPSTEQADGAQPLTVTRSGPLRATDELSAAERQALIASMTPDDAERVPELHEVEVPAELREQIEAAMGRYPELRSAVIPALWAVQRHHGWCSPEGIRQAAAVMGLNPAYLQSVASFYDLFHLAPAGEHRILVCHNISCWMRGADELLERFCEATGCDLEEAEHDGSTSPDGKFYVKGFECLGACDIAPMASIDEHYYGPLEPADVETVVDRLRRGESQALPGKDIRERKLAGGAEAPGVEAKGDG